MGITEAEHARVQARIDGVNEAMQELYDEMYVIAERVHGPGSDRLAETCLEGGWDQERFNRVSVDLENMGAAQAEPTDVLLRDYETDAEMFTALSNEIIRLRALVDRPVDRDGRVLVDGDRVETVIGGVFGVYHAGAVYADDDHDALLDVDPTEVRYLPGG